MPYIFFVALLLCWLYSIIFMGGISWQNNAYEEHFPLLAMLSIATTSLMLLFPAVVICVLIYNYRKWKKLLPALLAYSLYFAFLLLAGTMRWWVD